MAEAAYCYQQSYEHDFVYAPKKTNLWLQISCSSLNTMYENCLDFQMVDLNVAVFL